MAKRSIVHLTRNVALIGATAFAGCVAQVGGQDPAPVESAAAVGAPNAATTSLRVEQAARQIDVGRDVGGARAALEAILKDPATSAEERDQALFALSKALEHEGAHEQAIRTLEDLLAAHVEDHRWPMDNAVQDKLYKLLTGSDRPDGWRQEADEERPVAPFARVLTRFFPENAPGRFDIKILEIGGGNLSDEHLGTFNIGGAIRAMRSEACPLCDDRVSASTSRRGTGSWLSIPAYRDVLMDWLAVFYVAADQGRIPARYDSMLPMPTAELYRHLDKGEGVIVAKERRGAPPAILVAAPRFAQLVSVEEKLASMKALPLEAVVVNVDPSLKPTEIRQVLKTAKKDLRACYERVLKSDVDGHGPVPDASGKVVFKFAIRGDGTVADPAVEGELRGAASSVAVGNGGTLDGCLLAPVRALKFPATGQNKPTTVAYPIVFSSSDDAPAH